jgi:protein-tyrosine phosphatase
VGGDGTMSAQADFADRGAGAVLLGAPNFRDLGGYATSDGRVVGHGKLFRSGHLAALVPDDIALLRRHLGEALGVVDFRGSVERAAAVCAVPGAVMHSYPIEPKVAQRLDALAATGAVLDEAVAHDLMQDAYRNFVRSAQPQMAGFLRDVLEWNAGPVVLHCAAGKDRTGFATALLLEALGVSRELVFDDYLHTNVRLPPRRKPGRFPKSVMDVLVTVRPDFLQAAYDAIDSDFGGMDLYLKDALGFGVAERAHLRERYLRSA